MSAWCRSSFWIPHCWDLLSEDTCGFCQALRVGFLLELQPPALLLLNSGNLQFLCYISQSLLRISSAASSIDSVSLLPDQCRDSTRLYFFCFLFHLVVGQRAERNFLLSHPSALWSLVSKAHSPFLPLPRSRNFPDPHFLLPLMATQRQLFKSFDTYP